MESPLDLLIYARFVRPLSMNSYFFFYTGSFFVCFACVFELVLAELKGLALGENIEREVMDVFQKGKVMFCANGTPLGSRSVSFFS